MTSAAVFLFFSWDNAFITVSKSTFEIGKDTIWLENKNEFRAKDIQQKN